MNSTSFLVLGLVIAVVLVGSILQINKLVRKHNRVENAWAQVEVQLRRRHDLIPNLVETARGYATHERATFAEVTRARAVAAAANGPQTSAGAEDTLSHALASLLSLTEAYPDLKANQHFAMLQAELSTTENKISFARQYYNDGVLHYNDAVGTFPLVILARMLGFGPRTYFQAGNGAGPTQVRF